MGEMFSGPKKARRQQREIVARQEATARREEQGANEETMRAQQRAERTEVGGRGRDMMRGRLSNVVGGMK